jgi:Nucleoside-diphosphate-sugar epimerases
MKVIVVGGSGFIGSRFCARIKKSNHSFEILDKNPSLSFSDQVTIADVRFPISIRSTADVIINLAAEHRDDVYPLSLYDETNVNGAINICDLARQIKINKIIFTSSVAVYGFAPLGTNEQGRIMPFNDYGRTKWEAEKVFKEWQAEDSKNRTLVIVRPTVVFGERNRGNVFNLLKQIASGKFVMVGDGLNRKSMAYVENVAAFLEYSMSFKPGVHTYNYIDKPDFSMNHLVGHVNKLLGRSSEIRIRIPYLVGLFVGKVFDLMAKSAGRKFSISSIRIKKFCANSVYESAISKTVFVPPVNLMDAIEKTVRYEFIEDHNDEQVFYSE